MNPIRYSLTMALVLVAAALAATAVRAQAQDPPGLAIDVQGAATVAGRGRLAILTGLAPGAEVSLGPGARAVIVNSSTGRQYELTGPGAFRWSGGAIEIVRPGRLAVREPTGAVFSGVRLRTSRLAQASIVMRGPAEASGVRLVSPVSTWLLERPAAFRWEPVAGASGYRFELTDSTGKALHEMRTGATAVDMAAGLALEVGRTYGWQVRAELPGGKTVEGWTEFGLATPELRARVEAARPTSGTTFSDRVLYALLLEELGVHEEAARFWKQLAAERPDDPDLRARAQGR
jgi:hypothetical protein